MNNLNEFDNIKTPQYWKANLYNSIESKTRVIANPRKFPGIVAAVLAVAVLLSGTALAISLGWHIKLIEYLNPSEEQMQTLDGAVSMPEATITQNGVTITVKQTLADAFGIYVLYEMTVPENVELDDNVRWNLEILDAPTIKTDEYITTSSGGAEILEQAGNKRTVLYHLNTTAELESGNIKLTLTDLTHYSKNDKTNSMEITPIVEGKWDL